MTSHSDRGGKDQLVSESIKNMKKVDVYPYSLVQDETHNES